MLLSVKHQKGQCITYSLLFRFMLWILNSNSLVYFSFTSPLTISAQSFPGIRFIFFGDKSIEIWLFLVFLKHCICHFHSKSSQSYWSCKSEKIKKLCKMFGINLRKVGHHWLILISRGRKEDWSWADKQG